MDPRLQRAELLFDVKRHADALAVCREVLGTDPEDAGALYLAGFSALVMEMPGEAEGFGRALVAADPQSSGGFEILGYVDWGLERDMAAEAHFREALRLSPDNPHYHALLGRFLGHVRRLEEAITVAHQGLSLEPDSPVLAAVLQVLYRLNDEPDLAERYGRMALAAAPDSADHHLEAGLRLLEKGRRPLARGRFLDALRLDPAAGSSMETMAYERCRTHWFFRNGLYLPTQADRFAVAVLTPVFWYLLSVLFAPFEVLAWASLAVVVLGYGYVVLFRLCVRATLNRLRRGGG